MVIRTIRRVWSVRGLILVWWLSGLLLAFAAVVPLHFALSSFLGSSLAEVELREGLQVSHIVDFVAHNRAALPAILAGLLGAGVVWLPLSLVLSAGTVATLLEGRLRREHFGAALARWFGPFLRLELVALTLLPLVAIAPLLVRLGVRLVAGDPPSQPVEWWTGRATVVLVALGLVMVRLVVRFGRIEAVRNNESRAWRLLRAGLRATRRCWLGALAWTAAVALVAVGIIAAEAQLTALVPVTSGAALLVLFLGQQVLVLLRTTARLLRTAAEVGLVENAAAADEVEITVLAAALGDSVVATDPQDPGLEPVPPPFDDDDTAV